MRVGPRQRAICEASGFKCYADELVKQWDGAMVLPQFCDIRNPQDFVTGVRERAPQFTRPEAPNDFAPTILTDITELGALTSLDGEVLTGA